MGIDYTLIAGILLYILAVRALAAGRIKATSAAIIVVGGYFGLSCIVKGIIFHGYNIPLWQLFTLPVIMAVLLQFVTTLLVFAKMQHDGDDSYGAWLGWGAFGFVMIFFAIPFIVHGVLGQ